MRRVLVCGGRDYANRALLFRALNVAHAVKPIDLLIHGGARGADALGAAWALANGIEAQCFPADWKADGRAAGPIRNRRMLVEGKPDLVIAFPGGRGTADMKRQARNAGVTVVTVTE
jgi:predicted Rossmann-fold nucleotide-binding protein